MPRVVQHEQRRQELLDATWTVVASEGIEAATIRRIAEQAGCTTGRITHYFANKDDVLVAALRRVHIAAGKRMIQALPDNPGLQGLRAMLLEALPLDQQRIVEWQVWIAFWGNAATSPQLRREQHLRYEEWRALLFSVLQSAKRNGELPSRTNVTGLVEQLVALIDGLGLQGVLDPQHLPPGDLRSVLGNILDKLLS
jgi:AcrR family transcriptional regulator